jgi:hypothetical protein
MKVSQPQVSKELIDHTQHVLIAMQTDGSRAFQTSLNGFKLN